MFLYFFVGNYWIPGVTLLFLSISIAQLLFSIWYSEKEEPAEYTLSIYIVYIYIPATLLDFAKNILAFLWSTTVVTFLPFPALINISDIFVLFVMDS